MYYPNFISKKMTIKERVTNLLDQTQPFGYEMRLVKALLSAKMSKLGQPIAAFHYRNWQSETRSAGIITTFSRKMS